MAGLRKEIWVNQLTKRFYPDSSFLKYTKDFSALVENDVINMTDVGVDPNVLINNTTYPIAVVTRTDSNIAITLDLFETENVLVRKPDNIERSYDQLESVLMGHRNVLRSKTGEKAAHAFAPASDSTYTPVIKTTGASLGSGSRLRLQVADILALKERFDVVDIPLEDRYLILHPSHLTDLILEDVKAFKDITDLVEGLPKRFAGFNILQFSRPAIYNHTTMVKKAFAAAAAPTTDTFCSFAFHKDEVMKADGAVQLYQRVDDPLERGTIVGFDKRFIALPIRNQAIGAIVSTLVP